MKEADVAAATSHGLHHLNDSDASTEIAALQERYAGLWRVYVFVPAAAAEERLGIANEYAGG